MRLGLVIPASYRKALPPLPQYIVRAVNLPTDPFLRAYLECAEWCGLSDSPYCSECGEEGDVCPTCGEDVVSEREALESSVSPEWSSESLKRAEEDCKAFQTECAHDLEGEALTRAGHDFFLTRNQHGAGFWDGDYTRVKGERLTAACRPYGETSVSFDADSETLSLT